MTRKEMNGVWRFLGNFRPGDARLKDRDLLAAWWLTFGPYEADAVKQAIAAHFRDKPFFPDIKEISALLRSDHAGATAPQPTHGEADRRAREDMARMRELLRRQNPKRLEI